MRRLHSSGNCTPLRSHSTASSSSTSIGFVASSRFAHCFHSARCDPEQPRSPLDMVCSDAIVFLSYRQLRRECHERATCESLTSSPLFAEKRRPFSPCCFISPWISFFRSTRLSRLMYTVSISCRPPSSSHSSAKEAVITSDGEPRPPSFLLLLFLLIPGNEMRSGTAGGPRRERRSRAAQDQGHARFEREGESALHGTLNRLACTRDAEAVEHRCHICGTVHAHEGISGSWAYVSGAESAGPCARATP
jgi:hypothetical protein